MKKYILLSLLFFCNASIMMGQEKQLTISGHVFDESNESLPGVSVYLKDRAGVGTSTDINGAFKLSAQKGDMIIFSFIGYKKMEHIVLKDEKNLRIMLKSDSQQMDEVVITGMGTKEKKVNLTGAVTNVDISQIQTPATSLTNMLGGRVPGIISVQSSGEPGSNMSEFWIRGIGTFGASSSALVLIDGLEGDLNSIDPADIESFSVLKDASATAVYGVRGANGVVLVTTKHGTSDKMEVNVRANVKISYLTKLPEYLRAYDYAVLANEASAMRGAQPIYDDIELKAIQYHLDPDFYPDVFYKAIKMDTRGKKDGELQLAFMKNACDAARQDLTDFFRKTGMLKPIDQELDDYTCARMTITEADCKNLIAYARKYKKPESPVIYYISVNSAEAYKNRLPVRGVYNQGVTEQGNRRIISHDVWKNAVVFETYKDREMVRITMAGTDSRDNSSTTVPYPEGSTRIEAVSWDGRRTLVYGKRPDK